MFNMEGRILKNFNIMVNGKGNIGKADEITLPTVKFKTVEMPNGLDVPVNLDKLECEFSIADIDPAILTLVGLVHSAGTVVTFRGAIKDGLIEKPIVAVIGGSITEIATETKRGEKLITKIKMAVSVYNLNVGGIQCYHIDIPNYICMIGTVDYNLQTRINIGI